MKHLAKTLLTNPAVGKLDGEITVFDGDRPSFALLLAIEISPVDHASVRYEDPAPARAAPARG